MDFLERVDGIRAGGWGLDGGEGAVGSIAGGEEGGCGGWEWRVGAGEREREDEEKEEKEEDEEGEGEEERTWDGGGRNAKISE